MDNLEFLDAPQGANEEVQPVAEAPAEVPVEAAPDVAAEAPAEAAPEAAAESAQQPRDDKGRFVPKNAEAEPQPPPPGYVPVGVVQQLRSEISQLKQAAQPAPDIFEDSAGFVNHTVQPVKNEVTELKLEISRLRTEQKYGAETVDTAEQWAFQRAQIDPAFGQHIIASKDPYGAAVSAYKQEQISSKLSDPSRIDAFLAWEAAQSAAQAPTAAAAPVAAQPQPTPTRSLATAPSSGGAAHVPSGPGQAFDSLFMR